MNPVELSLFVSRMESICEEMGSILRRSAFSPNIKDRLDYSCALFDDKGELCAQAAHIPVHLGSMAYAMKGIISRFEWLPEMIVILNDPFLGGTHLPDVTLISPVFFEGSLAGFVVNRAHHADIGSETPGSMPNSSSLEEEGVVIAPQVLLVGKTLSAECKVLLHALGALDKEERITGDIAAQVSSVNQGSKRAQELISRMGRSGFSGAVAALNNYAEHLALSALAFLPSGTWYSNEVMDDDGHGTTDVSIALKLTVRRPGKEISGPIITADFSDSDPQVPGNVNCPLSVTAAAVYYVFRCLMPATAPACAGLFRPIGIIAEEGSVVHARYPAAVVAGNVETSMRLTDVVLSALVAALPDRIPAASQGTMNNIAMGGQSLHGMKWDYYETLGGGHGAAAEGPGASASHSHMTNTMNTPVESLELHYPLQVEKYAIREESGGCGRHRGGDGLVREYRFLECATLSLLTERRQHCPPGGAGGRSGARGRNLLNGELLPAKCTMLVKPDDLLRIETPGGGGWGEWPGAEREI